MNLYAKFYGFLKTWVSGPYYLSLFDVEFPESNMIRALNKKVICVLAEKKVCVYWEWMNEWKEWSDREIFSGMT